MTTTNTHNEPAQTQRLQTQEGRGIMSLRFTAKVAVEQFSKNVGNNKVKK